MNNKKYELKTQRHSSHTQLIELLKQVPRSSRILEVGIGCGCIGKQLFGHNLKITAIEKDGALAEYARGYYDNIFICDIDRENLPSLELFDFIILFDILEHLSDSLNVLERMAGLLKENGRLIISIPNIANWVIRLKLLFGNFDYSDRGILDRTHLRFFTFMTAKELIQEARLEIIDCHFTPIPFELFVRQKRLSGFLNEIYFLLTSLCPAFFSYQFIFTAIKSGKGASANA